MQDFRPQPHCCDTMAGTGSSKQPKFLSVFQRLSIALSNHDQCFCLKPKQVQCFESLIAGSDVIAVLPTGYGKSEVPPPPASARYPSNEDDKQYCVGRYSPEFDH